LATNPKPFTWLSKMVSFLEFEATEAIKPGQPVKLNAAGTIAKWVKTDALNLLIGYAYNEATTSGDLITVFMRGYAMIYGMSQAACDAGVGCEFAYNTANAIDGGINEDQDGLKGYSAFDNPGGGDIAHAWILDQAAGAQELIRVVYMH
jgi:hypothetical protein